MESLRPSFRPSLPWVMGPARFHVPYIPSQSSFTGSTRLNPKYTQLRDRGVGHRALTWPAAESEFWVRSLEGIFLLLLAVPESESSPDQSHEKTCAGSAWCTKRTVTGVKNLSTTNGPFHRNANFEEKPWLDLLTWWASNQTASPILNLHGTVSANGTCVDFHSFGVGFVYKFVQHTRILQKKLDQWQSYFFTGVK
jgi:hypothetical protein